MRQEITVPHCVVVSHESPFSTGHGRSSLLVVVCGDDAPLLLHSYDDDDHKASLFLVFIGNVNITNLRSF